LLLLAACAFAGGFAMRLVDPIVLPIAGAFGVPAATAALLVSAYAMSYALAQPVLGAVGDRLGKARLVRICVAALAVALVAGAVAPTFATLFASRVVAGVFGGGLVPLVLAMVGDRVPLAGRQVALGRMLFAVISGQMLGSAVSGAIASVFGWVAVLIAGAALTGVVAIAAWALLPVEAPRAADAAPPSSLATVYRTLFANPKTVWVYGAVFAEGMLFFGLFPYMGELLLVRGAATVAAAPAAAGAVLGAFGVGGLAFAAVVAHLVRTLGPRGLCAVGAGASALGVAAIAVVTAWPLAALAMAVAGFAFYMLHSTLQTEATELSPTARGTAFALFAGGLFLGQAFGPIVFGAALHLLGATATLLGTALLVLALGVVVVRRVAATRRGDDGRDASPAL
jgi:predicted MFS family arabinose efflux permease